MLGRYEPDRAMTVVASLDSPAFVPGSRWRLGGPSVSATVLESGQPARIDEYSGLAGPIAAGARESGLRSTVGVPITSGGGVWGVLTVATSRPEPLGEGTEARLEGFTELVATAISNAEAQDGLRRLADEQAALRRVATLVAQGASTQEVCSAAVEEVARVLDAPAVSLLRREPGRFASVVASQNVAGFLPGTRWPLDGPSITARVLETGLPTRVDNHSQLAVTIASEARAAGRHSALGVPITVDGQAWGVIAIGSATDAPLPEAIEPRLVGFTELIATVISNAESRDGIRRLADEQSALRRVATLVAAGAGPDELYPAISLEVGRVYGLPQVEMVRYEGDGTATVIGAAGDHPFAAGTTWTLDGPSIMEAVLRTGLPARHDDYTVLPGTIAEVARKAGFRAAIGAPILVGGAIWGAIVAISSTPEPIPEDAERRLGVFTELVATAVTNLQARDELRGLADEQAALRRVATLVAEGVTADQLFWSVANEVGHVLGVPGVVLDRFDSDGTAVTVALATDPDWEIARQIVYLGRRWSREDEGLSKLVWTTGRPARVDSYSALEGGTAQDARSAGVGSGCGTPIVVDGRLWGMIRVFTRGADALPDDAEVRLQDFTELVAAALSNAQASGDLEEIASEQAALRRVATLVAKGAQAEELLFGVAGEVAQVLGVSGAQVDRYEADGTAVVLATWRDAGWDELDSVLHVGMRFSPDPGTLTEAIQSTGHSARIEDYSDVPGLIGESSRAAGIGAACAAPIVVEGKLWGAIRAFSREDEALGADAESRLEGFTELVATAISNTQAHDDLAALADEQAALRRLATLVAEGTDSPAVFDAVCAEAGPLIGASSVNLSHYTSDGFNVTMAGWRRRDSAGPDGTAFRPRPHTTGAAIVATHAPVRIDSWEGRESELARL